MNILLTERILFLFTRCDFASEGSHASEDVLAQSQEWRILAVFVRFLSMPIGSMVLVYMLTWLGYIDGIHRYHSIHGSYGMGQWMMMIQKTIWYYSTDILRREWNHQLWWRNIVSKYWRVFTNMIFSEIYLKCQFSAFTCNICKSVAPLGTYLWPSRASPLRNGQETEGRHRCLEKLRSFEEADSFVHAIGGPRLDLGYPLVIVCSLRSAKAWFWVERPQSLSVLFQWGSMNFCRKQSPGWRKAT